MKNLSLFLFITCTTIFYSCSDSTADTTDPILQPTNITINAVIASDDSGAITVSPKGSNSDNFSIDWGDNSGNTEVAKGESATHNYSSSGSYRITVKASNTFGGESSISEQVAITVADTMTNAVMRLPITYDDSNVNYTFSDFGNASSAVIANPVPTEKNTSSHVASFTKVNGAEVWAGTTLDLPDNIDFSTPKTIKIMVWSPKAGAVIKVKCENVNNADDSHEVDISTTAKNEWVTLNYIFEGVPATATYSRISLFMDFGKEGDDTTFYFDQLSVENTKVTDDGKWRLTFEDNFDGNEFETPDTSKWETNSHNRKNNPDGPDGWWDADDAYLSGDGNLMIRVKKIANKNDDNDPHDFSVGMVRSKDKFEQKFGKFEIRCQLPEKSGWWVAFWLFSEGVFNENNSGEDGTEIDIMEAFGWTDKIISALHYDGYAANQQSDGISNIIPGIHDGFHTYGLEWNENEYIFFVDGNETWRTNFGGVSKVESYIKITGEIATTPFATSADWANTINESDFPDYFIIDYVKAYQQNEN